MEEPSKRAQVCCVPPNDSIIAARHNGTPWEPTREEGGIPPVLRGVYAPGCHGSGLIEFVLNMHRAI